MSIGLNCLQVARFLLANTNDVGFILAFQQGIHCNLGEKDASYRLTVRGKRGLGIVGPVSAIEQYHSLIIDKKKKWSAKVVLFSCPK